MIRRHATVALSGDGGDELFAGYPHYSWLQREKRVRRFIPGPLRREVGLLGRRLPIGFRGRNHLIGFAGDLARSIAHVNMYFDRASMLASLEVRAPFLDHRIIEFAFGRVSDRMRATENRRKILLRRLAKRLLPPTFDLERKQGFTMPLAAWFKGKWGDYVTSVLLTAEPGLFDRRTIWKLIAGQGKGYANTQRLFALTMFELWRREYRVEIPG
jgi:asparagine synthase (glutamine-hydrolysing)